MSTIEPEYINSAALATMLSVSKKFIEKHRHRIVGSRKIGGCWRFSVQEIRARLVTGRDIITTAKSSKA
jgi:hypothetical protein